MIRPFVKPVNALLTGYSYIYSSITGKAVTYGMPPALGVELTNNCNLKCPECSTGSGLMTRRKGFMDLKLFDKILSELKPYLYYATLYFQGESMMHPRFFSFLNRSLNINTIVSTNGHFLSEENAERIVKSGLNRLIVSLDGLDQKTYSSYRINGELAAVIQGIKNIYEAKKRATSPLRLEIQFLVNRENEHQIKSARHFAGEMKASFRLKSIQILNTKNFETRIPTDHRLSRYEKRDGKYFLKNPFPDRCARLWFNPVITWDGKVIPCCFDKDAQHIMGDFNANTFRDIWNGPKYSIFRKSILSERYMTEICRNCTSGLKGVSH
jgi:radical SAM protein with 4Fe4S-binding SPASM domain